MQNAPNASKHSFLPSLFSCERKDWAAGGASETTATERAAASDVSYPLCSFLPFQPQTEFAVWVLSQICDNLSVSLRLTAPLKGEPGVRAHSQCLPLCEGKPLSAAAGSQSLSRLRRQLPLHKGALGCARKKPSLRRKAQKRPRRNALLSGPVTENSEHHTPRAAARRTARPAPGQSRRCGRP